MLKPFRVAIVGPSGAGKTSLLLRLTDKRFCSNTVPTVGVDFRRHVFRTGDQDIVSEIYDTAGQERFTVIAANYTRKADAVAVIFDVSDDESHDKAREWLRVIHERNIPKVIVGNKVDLGLRAKRDDIRSYAAETGIEYFETSAKTGLAVVEAFDRITELAFHHYSHHRYDNDVYDPLSAPRVVVTEVKPPTDTPTQGCCR